MKKNIGCYLLTVIVILSACNDQEKSVTKENSTVPVKTVTTPASKPTHIVVDKKGISVETKKVGVTIKP